MSQCVPSWDLDDGPSRRLQLHQYPSSTTTRSPLSDYEVAELTWENGQLSMHGHRGGAARAGKLAPKDPSASVPSWEKTGHASGTLEAVVDQATRAVVPSLTAAAQVPNSAGCPLVPCLGGKSPYHTLRAPVPAAMDALVPCSNLRPQNGGDDSQPCRLVPDAAAGATDGGGGTCVASCSGRKRTRLRAGDGNCSVSGSAPSRGLTFDTCDINGAGEDTGFTSASPTDGSPETENTSFGRPLALTEEDLDSVSHSRRTQRDGRYEEEKIKGDDVGRSSVSTKRSRAAAVHNQSERKRRDRINQKMKTLQKLVPNSSKTDKASILDEAIEYLKQLQAQVQMVNRMSSVPHMMPMTMQHMQMAMMAQMAQMAQMGMGMGMMDMNSLGRGAEQPGLGPVLSTPPPPFFPPSSSWAAPDAPTGDRPQAPAGAVLPQDPFASLFMACQNLQQPTTSMDAYGRMTALYRQLYQQPPAGTNSKS